jgi:acetyl esterase
VLDRNRPLLKGAEWCAYKEEGGQPLEAYIFRPPTPEETPGAAMVFFASSLWDQAQISQFAPHCLYFASRGITCVLAEYRTAAKHQATPEHAMEDARDAILWLRLNAEELKVAPDKIVAAGGSAGAHAAIAAALWPAPEKKGMVPPASPNALVLFNPVLDTTRKEFEQQKFPTPAAAKAASPLHHLRKYLPPTLVLHGTADRAQPFANSKKFLSKMKWRGNICQLVPFEGEGHGFFNLNVDARLYEICLNEIDRFLVDLGWLPPAPEITDTARLATH